LRITSSKIIAERVLIGELELGVVGARWQEKKLTWTEMFSDELTLALHPAHPLAGRTDVSLKDVAKTPFILREPGSGTRKVFQRILEKDGLKENDLQVAAEIGSTAAVKEAIKVGIGISVLSKSAVQDDVNCGGRLTTIVVKGLDMHRPFYLIQRKNRNLSPVASAFVNYLQKNTVYNA